MVIMLDYPESRYWYAAEISQLLHDRFTVNGFITREATLVGYRQASKKLRLEALKGVAFHRTWCKDKGKGVAIRNGVTSINTSKNDFLIVSELLRHEHFHLQHALGFHLLSSCLLIFSY
jgi:hypothetical protein